MRISKTLMIAAVLTILFAVPLATLVKAEGSKPIIVCTTSAVGSVVREYLGTVSISWCWFNPVSAPPTST